MQHFWCSACDVWAIERASSSQVKGISIRGSGWKVNECKFLAWVLSKSMFISELDSTIWRFGSKFSDDLIHTVWITTSIGIYGSLDFAFNLVLFALLTKPSKMSSCSLNGCPKLPFVEQSGLSDRLCTNQHGMLSP